MTSCFFAEALAYKCISKQGGVIFFEGTNGVAVCSVGVQGVHCHGDSALDFVRAHVVSLIEDGIAEGMRLAEAARADALADAREEGRKEAYLAAIEYHAVKPFDVKGETSEELSRCLNDVVLDVYRRGKRVGWRDAAGVIDASFKETVEKAKGFEREEDYFNKHLSHAVENKRQAMAHAEALRQALAKVEEAAPKAEG